MSWPPSSARSLNQALSKQNVIEIFGITVTNHFPTIVAVVGVVTYLNIAQHLLRCVSPAKRRVANIDEFELVVGI